jgi:plasmid stabilization system protein ParE
MTYRVFVTAAAKENLRQAYFWAAQFAPQTAAAWLARFQDELQTLAHFPQQCALAPENALVESEIRQLIFGRRRGAFRVLFTILADEVRVLHVRRAARDWAEATELGVD